LEGNDVNATGAWAQGVDGSGVIIQITDVELSLDHYESISSFVPVDAATYLSNN
jgi:hypothetical protein